MNFLFRERVMADPDLVFAAFGDAQFYETIDLPHVGRPEVITISDNGSDRRSEIRYRYSGDLPPGANRFVTPDRLSWVEQARHRRTERLIEMDLVPDHYRDRFHGRATHRIIPIAPDDSEAAARPSCWWETTGSITIKLPFMARQVERAIVSGLGEDLGHLVGPLERHCRRPD